MPFILLKSSAQISQVKIKVSTKFLSLDEDIWNQISSNEGQITQSDPNGSQVYTSDEFGGPSEGIQPNSDSENSSDDDDRRILEPERILQVFDINDPID
jgi:hypothetical protein